MAMDATSGDYLRYNERGMGDLSIGDASYGPGGLGAHISYTIAPSQFGGILLAATQRGVCWIGIHESDAYLESELHADFPKAVIFENEDAVHDLADRMIGFVSGTGRSFKIPLDIRATTFQLAVWRELCTIPAGSSRSYGDIARRLGRPNASRAVGHANGSNPLALVIPCHRAVGADGKLTGYRWGLEYKRRLLEHERVRGEKRVERSE
jgi:AraC family transcriptional regulator of adaptative response/methylated-DNA-[protein]-cysteine methyltransferase